MFKAYLKQFFIAVICATCAVSLSAQTAAISGIITDANGQAYANGTYTITFRPVPGNPGPYYQKGTTNSFTESFTGALDSNGSFSGITLQRNDYISPAQTSWAFKVCSQASSPCYSINLVIAASSVDISTLVTPPAIQVSPGALQLAYSDSETIPSGLGSEYSNLIDNSIHYCTAVSGNSCSSWSIAANSENPVIQNLTSIHPAITPTSIEQVLYADQFSGADIGAQVNAAYAAGNAVVIQPGIYTFSTPIVLPAASGCSFTGAGSGLNGNYVSILKYTGTGSAISQFTTNQNAGGCQLSGFVVDGSADTNTNVSGINFGGSNNFTTTNVVVQHFNQSGDAGIKLENKSGRFTERYFLSPITLYDNTKNVLMAVDSGGDPSFEHGYINGTFSADTATGQTWISVTGGGSLSASTLVINGNCGDADIGCTAFSVDGTSSITDDSISFLPECDASGSGACTIFDDPTGGNVALISPGPFNSGGWTLKSGSGTISLDGWIGGSFSGTVGNSVPLCFQNASGACDATITEGVGGALTMQEGIGNPGLGFLNNLGTWELYASNGSGVAIPNAGLFSWSSTGSAVGTADTGFSRTGPGIVALGNGVQGNATGTLNLGTLDATALEQGGNPAVTNGGTSLTSGTPTCGSGVAAVANCSSANYTSAGLALASKLTGIGSGTYTTGTSDSVSITWADGGTRTPTACAFSPTNSTAAAATVIGYISAYGSNSVTISHVATSASGGTVAVLCSGN